MKRLEVGKVYKFLVRENRKSTTVYDVALFEYSLETEKIRSGPSWQISCPLIFTVVDVCPHLCAALNKNYYCYKILVGDKLYTKYVHQHKEIYIEEVC